MDNFPHGLAWLVFVSSNLLKLPSSQDNLKETGLLSGHPGFLRANQSAAVPAVLTNRKPVLLVQWWLASTPDSPLSYRADTGSCVSHRQASQASQAGSIGDLSLLSHSASKPHPTSQGRPDLNRNYSKASTCTSSMSLPTLGMTSFEFYALHD